MQLALSESSWQSQETLHPFVTDARLPDDTLFWIIEEDFRFSPPGEDPDKADNYEQEGRDRVADVVDLIATTKAGSSLPPSQKGSAKGRVEPTAAPKKLREGRGRAYRRPKEAPTRGNSNEDDKNHGFSRDVADVMRIATFAHRKKVGDFIWLTFAHRQKATRIGHGSACVLLTKFAFDKIAVACHSEEIERGPIDLVLQAWLRESGEANSCRACYVYPPIGSYTEQKSECGVEPTAARKKRASAFTLKAGPCHGAREAGDPKWTSKSLYQWTNEWSERKIFNLPAEAQLHTREYEWKSWLQPTSAHPTKPWHDWWANPGEAERQKPEYQAFNLRLSKRLWVEEQWHADAMVPNCWIEKCWEPEWDHKALLHYVPFQAAPDLKKE